MREDQNLWAAIGPEGFEVFKKLTHVYDFRVLMAFLERMGGDNFFIGTQTEVAKNLGISPQSVSTTFRRLCEQNILSKSEESGITRFQLNPDLARKVRLVQQPDDEEDEDEDFLNEWQDAIERHRAAHPDDKFSKLMKTGPVVVKTPPSDEAPAPHRRKTPLFRGPGKVPGPSKNQPTLPETK